MSGLFSRCAALLIGTLLLLGKSASADEGPRLVEGGGQRISGVFTAGRTGARYSMPGGGQLVLRPGTQAHIAAIPQLLPLRPGRRTPTYSVVLHDGRIDIDVQPKGYRIAVLVAAPCGLKTIVLKGRAAALATADDASVANLGADVLTNVDERWLTLDPSMVWTMERGSPQGRKQKLISPPTPIAKSSVLMGLTGQAMLPEVRWDAVPGAQEYHVALSLQSQADPVDSLVTRSTGLSGELGPLGPGRYELRVASIDARGLMSTPSEPLAIRVLGAELPLGATALDDATLELGQGQTLTFTESDGMLMSYTGANGLLAASSPVGLDGSRSRVVLLTLPGTAGSSVVRLVPRKLAARIRFGPVNLDWPGPPASVTVELTNDGQPIPSWLVPVAAATLNLEPVATDFVRQGDTLAAAITAPDEGGPWVLRVEVRDQTGALLGRDFQEIARRRPTSSSPRLSSAGQPR